jgi:hypothetical protein
MIHVFDYGVEIRLDTEIDLKDFDSAKILYEKPSGATGEWAANIDGTEVVYIVKPNDIDEVGLWTLQAQIQAFDSVITGRKTVLPVMERVR